MKVKLNNNTEWELYLDKEESKYLTCKSCFVDLKRREFFIACIKAKCFWCYDCSVKNKDNSFICKMARLGDQEHWHFNIKKVIKE